MNCPSCGAENPAEQKFCNECAAPFKRRCAKCGYENPPTAKFCGECATALTSSVSKPTAAIPSTPSVRVAPESSSIEALEGERKTVTALFADIKGSTELKQDLDPEEARAIVDPALQADDRRGPSLRRLRRAIHRRRHLRAVRRARRARGPSAARAVRGAADAGRVDGATRRACARPERCRSKRGSA